MGQHITYGVLGVFSCNSVVNVIRLVFPSSFFVSKEHMQSDSGLLSSNRVSMFWGFHRLIRRRDADTSRQWLAFG